MVDDDVEDDGRRAEGQCRDREDRPVAVAQVDADLPGHRSSARTQLRRPALRDRSSRILRVRDVEVRCGGSGGQRRAHAHASRRETVSELLWSCNNVPALLRSGRSPELLDKQPYDFQTAKEPCYCEAASLASI